MTELYVFIPSPRASWDETELYAEREVALNRMLRAILYEMSATRGNYTSQGRIEWYEHRNRENADSRAQLVYRGTYCTQQVEHRVWTYAKKNDCHLREAIEYFVRRPHLLYETNVRLLAPEERRPSKL